MNAPERMAFPDIQSQFDSRNVHIDAVGVKGVRYPVTISARGKPVATIAEGSASCEVYSLLKRADEKYVTEAAYDNPKFVEDLVRDVALALNREPRIRAYVVEAENFESIHNHSAFARVVCRKDQDTLGAWPAPRKRNLSHVSMGCKA